MTIERRSQRSQSFAQRTQRPDSCRIGVRIRDINKGGKFV